jgi:pimeloyl-ACP methyl ester carboxylesterase
MMQTTKLAAPSRVDASRDSTAEFLSIYKEVAALGDRKSRASIPAACYDCDYLFVPGLLTRWNTGYFSPNMQRLASLGLTSRLTWAPHTMGAILANGESMRRELEAHTRPVVVFGHSKGALDTWAALSQHPELAAKVRAFVALQSPVFGSEVADWYRATAFRRWAVRTGARLTGGSEQAVWDLTTASREAFVSEFPFPEPVQAFSIVSTFTRRFHRFYVGTRAMGLHGSAPHDGMVSVERGVIPGSRWIRLEDMDHLDPVSASDGIEQFFASTTYDPAHLTEALLRLIFG